MASSGDSGFVATQFPSNLDTVTAAGGTELARARGARGWAERVGTPATAHRAAAVRHLYQSRPGSTTRSAWPGPTSDVSAVAANLAVYDSSLGTTGPWLPGRRDQRLLPADRRGVRPGRQRHHRPARVTPTPHTSGLFDVTKGNNDYLDRTRGAACDYTYLCMATKGYDGPTGLGTPDGTSAF